jgi:hypothetical protein
MYYLPSRFIPFNVLHQDASINVSLNFKQEHSPFIEKKSVKFTVFLHYRRNGHEQFNIIIFHARQVGLKHVYTPIKEDDTCHLAVENIKHDRLLSFITLHLY